MGVKRFLRLKHNLRCIRALLSDSSVVADAALSNRRLLLIKTEAIGDYVLFRNFLEDIRKSELYKSFEITLVGNSVWQSLATTFDSSLINRFVFLDKGRFQLDWDYRNEIMKEIFSETYQVAVNCTFSREFLLGDSIMRGVSAAKKIGMKGDSVSEMPWFYAIANSWYTELVNVAGQYSFEFYRNRSFFSDFLKVSINRSAPELPVTKAKKSKAVLLPGAQASFRQWPAGRFAETARWLHNELGFEVSLAGAPMDMDTANCVIEESGVPAQNFCGKLSLPQLAELMAEASLVVCNDSGPVHIAAALNVAVVCISNGNHYSRFVPYPDQAGRKVICVFPDEFTSKYKDDPSRARATRFGSGYSIQGVRFVQVKNAIKTILPV